ncbi:MAG TPA: FtsK/SpoIIIE domain-containing protein [Ktedonobacteraceae bacterium]
MGRNHYEWGNQHLSLLALHQVSQIGTLDIRQLWQRTGEQQLLCAPIGLQRGGPLLLDLKEPATGGYGPHGLVVGATGSGKTELLRTIVTSLSLTHNPFLLNFVLVTSAGGTAFAAFEKLSQIREALD